MNDYKPTSGMVSAAKRGLKMREEQPPSNRGGTDVGIARARDITSGKSMPLDTVKRMYSFFSRHEVDKSSESWKKGNSKGEQAWLLWGGDAGFSWSRSIVKRTEKSDNKTTPNGEYNEMSDIRINLLNTINAEKIRIDKTKEDGKDIIYIRNHNFLKDEIVLNGGLYSAEDNEKGYQSMEGRLFTNGHPKVEGKFVAISNQDNVLANKALENHYIGASNVNIRKQGNDYLKDIRVNVDIAKGTQAGKKLIEWCNAVNSGMKPEGIHTSTGLLCNRQELQGNSRGKNYTWKAVNQRYDHDALLLNEVGAGGDEIALSVNQEEIECFTVNMDDAEHSKDSILFLPADESDEVKVNWMQKIAKTLGFSVKSTKLTTNEDESMNVAQKLRELLGADVFTGNETDEEIVDKFKKKRRDQDKAGGVSGRVEKDEDEDEDEELDENKKKPTAKDKKAMNSADIQALIDQGVKDALAANQANAEKTERETIVNSLVANAAITEDEKADYMQTPLSVLRKMATNSQAAPIADYYGTNSAKTSSLKSMKIEEV